MNIEPEDPYLRQANSAPLASQAGLFNACLEQSRKNMLGGSVEANFDWRPRENPAACYETTTHKLALGSITGLRLLKSTSLPGFNCGFAFSDDGEYVAISQYTRADTTGTVVFDKDINRNPWPNVIVSGGFVRRVAFTSDNKNLVIASYDGKICVWEQPGLEQRGWPLAIPEMQSALRIHSVSCSSSADIVVAASWRRAYVWHVQPNTHSLRSIDIGHSSSNVAVLNSTTTMVLTSSDQLTAIWDVSNGAKIGSDIPRPPGFSVANFDPAGSLAVVGAIDGSALLWDIRNNRVGSKWNPHKKRIFVASFSPNGKFVLTASEDGTACVWDYARGAFVGKAMHMSAPIVEALFSPDGSYILTASLQPTNEGKLALWDTSSGDLVAEATLTSLVTGLSFSPDGHRILAGIIQGAWTMFNLYEIPGDV